MVHLFYAKSKSDKTFLIFNQMLSIALFARREIE